MAAEQGQVREVRQGLFSRLFSLFSRILGVLIISLILSILFEWIGITWFWPDEGYRHSQQMMLTEISWFTSDFTQSLLHTSPHGFAEYVITQVHEYLFVKTGLARWLEAQHAHGSMSYYVYFYARAYIESIIYVTITFIIRVLIIVFTSPLFLLAAIVGLTDGLVRRDIRRFGYGYESSFIYHHAKRTVFPILTVAWMIYLAIPFSVHPNFILIPAAILLGLAISITSASFKKYL
ncbi:TIGR03747 family integrating conjugative element membrane protein [Testudinibacter sp. P80/BLE/0925]|uniref:TIGR03747 family integrating conjugative element membrane protein n=1 Tax=Testudinibacter sp. TW-1 TaxID=3417757 RepID=UPI003D36AB3B